MVWMKAHDSMMVSNRNARPGMAKVSALVAISSQANTAPTLAQALTMVSTRMAKPPSSWAKYCRWMSVTPLWAIIQNARMR